MALYKNQDVLEHSTHRVFDALHAPGANTVFSGIYRCHGCGHEVISAKGHTLPPQNHHQHGVLQGSIEWRLVIATTPQ